MRKLLLLIVLALAASTGAFAQSKINSTGHLMLARYHQQAKKALSSTGTSAAPVVSAIVQLSDNASADDLREAGYDVTSEIGRYVIVRVALDKVEEMAELDAVRTVSMGGKKRMLMNYARTSSGVEEAHSGIRNVDGTITAYTGKGVVCGIMDGGLDPNHINFKNADGTSRVKRLWHFPTDDDATDYVEKTDANMSTFTTDDETETHATHVAGIMAGGYRGTGDYINITDPETGESELVSGGNIPFYGVAYESDLALSCGSFSDACILAGVEKVINYAEQQGQPCVVNLSLGSNYGPHDGTDDFAQALDELGKRGIICVAAGNEGDMNITIGKDLTATDNTVKTIIYYMNDGENYTYTSNSGLIDIWSDTSTPFTLQIANVSSSGTLSNSTTVSPTADGTLVSTPVRSGGKLYAYGGVDPNNDRYNMCLSLTNVKQKSGRLAFIITGTAGQHIDIYYHGETSFFSNLYGDLTNETTAATATKLSGYSAGTPDQSISGMACGRNIIAVGAYNSTIGFNDFNQGYEWGFGQDELGAVTTFSSYGPDFFGRQLPVVLAPGSALVSSYSRRYVAKGYEAEGSGDMLGRVTKNGVTDYWGAMQGTSMATPFMSGTVALWLQANPELKVENVLDVIKNSSTNDTYTQREPEKAGYGKVNAAEGLKYILAAAAIGSVTDDDRNLIINTSPYGVDIFLAGATSITGELYDLQGRRVASAAADSDRATMATGSLAHGLYVVKVSANGATHTRKIAL